MAETLSHLKAQFIDTAIDPDSSKEKFEAFHSHLVRNVIDGKNDKFSQIVEGNVYRDFLPGETVITVSLIVRDPISKSVCQADRLISDSASAVGINVVDDTPPSEDKYNLEQDGISLISINGPLISIESKSIGDPKRTNELHKDKTAFTGMAKTLKTAETSTTIKRIDCLGAIPDVVSSHSQNKQDYNVQSCTSIYKTGTFNNVTYYTGLTNREPSLVRFARKVDSHLGAFLTSTGSALLAMAAFFPTSSLQLWLFLAGGVSCTTIGQIKSEKKTKSFHKILIEIKREREQKRTAQNALFEAIEDIGINLSKELGLWSSKVRFTVYAHDIVKRQFIPIVRISDNPTLAHESRTSYSDSQGYLGEIWRKGECSHMGKRRRTVKAEFLNSGFTEEEYRNLTLIPCSLKGVRLHKATRPVGAILWESEDPKRIDTRDPRLDNIKDNATLLDLQAVFAASTLLFSDLSEHFFEKSS
jgi:hypothetical protein